MLPRPPALRHSQRGCPEGRCRLCSASQEQARRRAARSSDARHGHGSAPGSRARARRGPAHQLQGCDRARGHGRGRSEAADVGHAAPDGAQGQQRDDLLKQLHEQGVPFAGDPREPAQVTARSSVAEGDGVRRGETGDALLPRATALQALAGLGHPSPQRGFIHTQGSCEEPMAPATAAAPHPGTKGRDSEKMKMRDTDKLNHVRATQGCCCKPEPPQHLFPAHPVRTSNTRRGHHAAQHGTSRLAARSSSHAVPPQKAHRASGCSLLTSSAGLAPASASAERQSFAVLFNASEP